MFSPLTELLIYFSLMGIVHAAITVAGLAIASPMLFFNATRYLVFARGYIVFNLILVFVCALLNLLWSYAVWGVVYFSTDYVTDFSPFWPITQHMIDSPFCDMTGKIFHGLNILHVQAIWLLFAFTAWASTIFLYSRLRRIWSIKTHRTGCQLSAPGRASA